MHQMSMHFRYGLDHLRFAGTTAGRSVRHRMRLTSRTVRNPGLFEPTHRNGAVHFLLAISEMLQARMRRMNISRHTDVSMHVCLQVSTLRHQTSQWLEV